MHKISLLDATIVAPFGSSIVYTFTGGGTDSLRVDADGRVYVAIYGQGRIMVSNPLGLPIGQYLSPSRDQGQNLRSTSMVIRPDTDELLILTNDCRKNRG